MDNLFLAQIPLPDDCFVPPPRDIKLPPFWQASPVAWFVFAECRFWLRNILDETLFCPAGKLIPCWGERSISLQFNNKKFTWTFLLAAVARVLDPH
jgi:hypothetical protein